MSFLRWLYCYERKHLKTKKFKENVIVVVVVVIYYYYYLGWAQLGSSLGGGLVYLFIYLSLAVLGLRCCAWACSSCGEQGLLFVAVHGLLIAVASLVAEHGL